MENIFKIEVDGVEQYPITSQKAVNSSNGVNIDDKFNEIDSEIEALLPINGDYSALKNGEFVNLFEKSYNQETFAEPLSYDGTQSTHNSTPLYFTQQKSNIIHGLKVKCLKAGTITFGLGRYPYYDAEIMPPFTLTEMASFYEELFTVTISESDVGDQLRLNLSSSRVSNQNEKYWNNTTKEFTFNYAYVLGFQLSDPDMVGSNGLSGAWNTDYAKYAIDASGTLTSHFDSTAIAVEYKTLGYECDDIQKLTEKQDLLNETDSIKLIHMSDNSYNVELSIDDSETKGNVELSVTNNGLKANINLSEVKGAVESVNNKTGAVILTANDVNAYDKTEVDTKIQEIDEKIKTNYSFIKEFVKADIIEGKLSINHQLGSLNILVSVYDDSNNLIIPTEITLTDLNNLVIDLTDFVDTLESTYRALILSIEGVTEVITRQSSGPELPVNEDYSVIHNGQYINLFGKDEENNYLIPEIKELSESAKSTNQTSETIIKTEYNTDGSINQVLQPIDTTNLPSDFPQYTITGESSVKANFYVCPDSGDDIGWLMILNYKGELLWYKNTGSYTTCFRRYVNSKGKNRYCYLTNINDEFPRVQNFYYNTVLYVLDENFIEIDRVYMCAYNSVENNGPTENHDYMFIDDGHYILANYYQVGGVNPFYNQIQEVKNRKLVWAIDTLDYPELRALSHTNTTLDPTHFNAILEDYDGNYIISFRNVGLVKFKKSDKSVMWVIGKNQCDFTGIDTTMIPFQQHDIKVVYKDGSYTIFDNYGHSSKSRVLRYWLDENTMTATVKEYVTTYARSGYMGSAVMVDFENEIFDIAYGSAFDVAFQEYNFKTEEQVMLMKFNDKSDTYRIWRDI